MLICLHDLYGRIGLCILPSVAPWSISRLNYRPPYFYVAFLYVILHVAPNDMLTTCRHGIIDDIGFFSGDDDVGKSGFVSHTKHTTEATITDLLQS